jgi:tRNA threonylcarbamoyladenosine biosynthesis protein TsaB
MSESKYLAIETSSATGSIALTVDGFVIERVIATPREQTPLMLALIDELLSEADIRLQDLDALVLGRGPGSFTGLRVAAAVVQGLSLAAGVPIVSVSSLAALAARAFTEHAAAQQFSAADSVTDRALCCIDARMNEVYWACFRRADGQLLAESDERIGSPESVVRPESSYIAVGDGFAAHAAALAPLIDSADCLEPALVPGARELLALAAADVRARRFVPVESALPVYLRGPDAWQKTASQKSGSDPVSGNTQS